MNFVSAPATPEELLACMVEYETVNPRVGGQPTGQRRLAEAIERWACEWNLTPRRFNLCNEGFNLFVSCEIAASAEWLIFDSHLDTVSAEGMSVEPFAVTAVGERFYGRGVCDTKGSGAAMLWALREYAAKGIGTRNIAVIFTLDEEAGMGGVQAFVKDGLDEFLPRLRGVVVGEPTLLRPVIATNGVVRWKTITRGLAAHSADPSRGRSAISEMARVISLFEESYVPSVTKTHPLTGHAAASINMIRGGSQINIIADYCEIGCDRRLTPGESIAQILMERDVLFAAMPEVEHQLLYSVPPLSETASQTLFQWMAPILRCGGFQAHPQGASYVSNGSFYANAGASVIILGPGDIVQAHTKDEWLERSQLIQAARIYGSLMSAH